MGIILYTLIYGEHPFDSKNGIDIDKYLKGEIDFKKKLTYSSSNNLLRFISSNCQDLITRMLCADPDNRYSINEVLNHSWLRDLHNIYKPRIPELSIIDQATYSIDDDI